MRLEETVIKGLYEIYYDEFEDKRGIASKAFCKEILSEYNIEFNVDDIFYSISNKDVIRGMHFQNAPYEQDKIISVIKGEITDVVIDLRKDSKTYLKYQEFNISSKDNIGLLVPKGCAHGFRAMSDETIVLYAINGIYSKNHDSGIRYDSFGYDWSIENPILSERDIKLNDINKYYEKLL